MCTVCRAGQELGPSAALLPLQNALVSLQSRLQPGSKLWGPATLDLLQQLSQAALFQELCSGDMHAVPGLSTSSRLTCLMDLLKEEAESPTDELGSEEESDLERRSGTDGQAVKGAPPGEILMTSIQA